TAWTSIKETFSGGNEPGDRFDRRRRFTTTQSLLDQTTGPFTHFPPPTEGSCGITHWGRRSSPRHTSKPESPMLAATTAGCTPSTSNQVSANGRFKHRVRLFLHPGSYPMSSLSGQRTERFTPSG